MRPGIHSQIDRIQRPRNHPPREVHKGAECKSLVNPALGSSRKLPTQATTAPFRSARDLLLAETLEFEFFLLKARAQTLELQSFSVKLEMILLGGGVGSVAAERNLLGVESFLLEGRAQAVKAEYF